MWGVNASVYVGIGLGFNSCITELHSHIASYCELGLISEQPPFSFLMISTMIIMVIRRMTTTAATTIPAIQPAVHPAGTGEGGSPMVGGVSSVGYIKTMSPSHYGTDISSNKLLTTEVHECSFNTGVSLECHLYGNIDHILSFCSR